MEDHMVLNSLPNENKNKNGRKNIYVKLASNFNTKIVNRIESND